MDFEGLDGRNCGLLILKALDSCISRRAAAQVGRQLWAGISPTEAGGEVGHHWIEFCAPPTDKTRDNEHSGVPL